MKRLVLSVCVAMVMVVLVVPAASAAPRSVVSGKGAIGQVVYLGSATTFSDTLSAISATYQSTGPIEYWGDVALQSWYSPGTGIYYPGHGYAPPAYALTKPAAAISINGKSITMQQLGGSPSLSLWVNETNPLCTFTWRSCDFTWVAVKGFDGKRYSRTLPEYEVQAITVQTVLDGSQGWLGAAAAAELAAL